MKKTVISSLSIAILLSASTAHALKLGPENCAANLLTYGDFKGKEVEIRDYNFKEPKHPLILAVKKMLESHEAKVILSSQRPTGISYPSPNLYLEIEWRINHERITYGAKYVHISIHLRFLCHTVIYRREYYSSSDVADIRNLNMSLYSPIIVNISGYVEKTLDELEKLKKLFPLIDKIIPPHAPHPDFWH